MTFDFTRRVAVAPSLSVLHGSILTIEERPATPAGPQATKESCAGGTGRTNLTQWPWLGSIPFPSVDTSYAHLLISRKTRPFLRGTLAGMVIPRQEVIESLPFERLLNAFYVPDMSSFDHTDIHELSS